MIEIISLFFIVIFLYIGCEKSMSYQQLLSELALGDFQLFVSGNGILILTVVAILMSFKYNLALATKNTDLVTNAVILLFIDDLDESFLSCKVTSTSKTSNPSSILTFNSAYTAS